MFTKGLGELEAAILHIGDVFDAAVATFDAEKASHCLSRPAPASLARHRYPHPCLYSSLLLPGNAESPRWLILRIRVSVCVLCVLPCAWLRSLLVASPQAGMEE